MKNVIKIRYEDLKNDYTEGQVCGIGIYYYDPVDKEHMLKILEVCVYASR